MNLIKLASTDFFRWSNLALRKGEGLLDLLWFILRNPQAKSLRLAALILQLIPRYTKVSVKRLINLYRLTHLVSDTDKGKQAESTRRYSRVWNVKWWICRHYGGSGPRR